LVIVVGAVGKRVVNKLLVVVVKVDEAVGKRVLAVVVVVPVGKRVLAVVVVVPVGKRVVAVVLTIDDVDEEAVHTTF